MLIVEDEAVIAMDLEIRVQKLGYRVAGVTAHGDRALEMAGQLHPDLVLMDVNILGDRDGVTIATEIRERYDIPSIFLTAYSDDETIARATDSNPLGYLIKPIAERELKAAIEISLYKHRLDKLLAGKNRELAAKIEELEAALAQVRELSALLPICAWCKNIRNEKGYWEEVSDYISTHTNTMFTHGICEECQQKMMGDHT
jgi:DNA-binding response OmpR family regulator